MSIYADIYMIASITVVERFDPLSILSSVKKKLNREENIRGRGEGCV